MAAVEAAAAKKSKEDKKEKCVVSSATTHALRTLRANTVYSTCESGAASEAGR